MHHLSQRRMSQGGDRQPLGLCVTCKGDHPSRADDPSSTHLQAPPLSSQCCAPRWSSSWSSGRRTVHLCNSSSFHCGSADDSASDFYYYVASENYCKRKRAQYLHLSTQRALLRLRCLLPLQPQLPLSPPLHPASGNNRLLDPHCPRSHLHLRPLLPSCAVFPVRIRPLCAN